MVFYEKIFIITSSQRGINMPHVVLLYCHAVLTLHWVDKLNAMYLTNNTIVKTRLISPTCL